MDSFDQLYILSQEVGRQDVTQNYRDNETRIAVLEEEEVALRELMQEQGTLEELLQIRRRLTEVISEREIFENQNQAYDEQVAYSTVELSLQQTDRASSQDLTGFWDRFTNAIVDSFYSFISVLQDLLISFVYFLPFLVIFGILGWIIYRFIKNVKNQIYKIKAHSIFFEWAFIVILYSSSEILSIFQSGTTLVFIITHI